TGEPEVLGPKIEVVTQVQLVREPLLAVDRQGPALCPRPVLQRLLLVAVKDAAGDRDHVLRLPAELLDATEFLVDLRVPVLPQRAEGGHQFASRINVEARNRRVSPDLTSAMVTKRSTKSTTTRLICKQKAPISRAFVVAGAGFEPATSGL